MIKSTTTCYMCDKPGIGKEHIPPRCIFPEQKDSPDRVDYRKALFTVPSCDDHNSNKSKDDEYLLYVLTISHQRNSIGGNQYLSKVRRSIERNPSLLQRLSAKAQPATAMSIEGMGSEKSVAFKLEEDRFERIIDRTARAIYYWHYQEKWLNQIDYQAEFLYSKIDHKNEVRSGQCRQQISRDNDIIFINAACYGKNPDVFKYKVVEYDDIKMMRLYFYEECKLFLSFLS